MTGLAEMRDEFFARSASDKTEEWPFWFVARRSNPSRNIFAELCDALGLARGRGQVLENREDALRLAALANAAPTDLLKQERNQCSMK